MDTSYRDRFKEADWYNPDYEVCIGGLGSIGSWLSLFMSRLVNQIYTYEMDTIEAHNLSGQFYHKGQIGKSKFLALKQTINHYAPDCTMTNLGEYKENNDVLPITFACFDSMTARQHMFEKWQKLEDKVVFIDGRLTAEQFWMYVVTPDREEEYKEYLFDEDEVDELPCSFKSTTHISSMLASVMTNAFTNVISNLKHGSDDAELPFEVTYHAPLFMFNK